MKKIVCIVVMFVLLVTTAYADEPPKVTYEGIVSGEYYGETVEVDAKALRITPYYNFLYQWAVKKEDGSFEVVDNSELGWCVTKENYEKASKDEKEAFGKPDGVFTLRITLRNDGDPRVQSFRLYGTESKEKRLERTTLIGVIVLVVILAVMFVIAYLYDHSERGKKSRMMARAKPIRTKLVDSSHTVYTQKSTSSTVGRAIVGGAIGGGIGAIVGASTGKNKNIQIDETTFMVYYDNGVRKVETVSNGSFQYDRYMKLLDVD